MAYREGWFRSQDGLRLFYRDYDEAEGAATPVLCLSGLVRNSADFERVAARLAPKRRVIAPDYRGRGRSQYDPDWRRYEPRTYIGDIIDLLTVLGIERTVVIGTSLGGLLGMGLVALQPRLLAGLVLNDIGPELIPGGLARIIDYIGNDRPQPD